jgi:hypothetical protein
MHHLRLLQRQMKLLRHAIMLVDNHITKVIEAFDDGVQPTREDLLKILSETEQLIFLKSQCAIITNEE